MLGNNSVVLKFEQNSIGKDYVVGDVHGCLAEFNDLLKAINFNKTTDRMFSVGDLIDRGSDSVGCAELIYEKWFFNTRANHEQMLIDAIQHGGQVGPSYMRKYDDKVQHWIQNGGSWHHEIDIQLLRVLAEDFNKSPYVIVVGEGDNRINIVHAEIIAAGDADIDAWMNTNQISPDWQKNELIWGRSHIFNPYAKAPSLSLTIVGHTPQMEPVYHSGVNHLYIDTGCVIRHMSDNPTQQDRKLSCVNITDPKNIEVISYSGLYKNINTYTMNRVTNTLELCHS